MDIEFKAYNNFKPFHKMTFVEYEFTINGNDIEFDERILPQQMNVKNGDTYVAKVDDFGKITLEKI